MFCLEEEIEDGISVGSLPFPFFTENSAAHRVVGIVPKDWGFPSDQGVWVPLLVPVTADPAAHAPGTMLVGRLPVGGSAAVASARSQALIRAAVTLEDRRPAVDARPFVRALKDVVRDLHGGGPEDVTGECARLLGHFS